MSIGKRITEAIERLAAGDAKGAMVPAMIALDAAANKTYRKIKGNNVRFKNFVHGNLDVITRFANVGILVDGGEIRFNNTRIFTTEACTPNGCHPIQ